MEQTGSNEMKSNQHQIPPKKTLSKIIKQSLKFLKVLQELVLEVLCLPLEAPLLVDLFLQIQKMRITIKTMMTNAMHPPMMPHIAPSESPPDPRAPVAGDPVLSP